MEILRFPIVEGMTPELLSGTDRFAYALSDFADAWELPDWEESGGYQGAVLQIYDLYENKVHKPFDKKKNVTYQKPLFYKDMIYFLQTDFDEQKVCLFKLTPTSELQEVTRFSINEINLYNLGLTGEDIHITSQDDTFVCYYPDPFEIKLEPNESVLCISGDKIYFNAWIEEGIDSEEIAYDYRYYEKLLIKDRQGNLISEEVGSLNRFLDGRWRLS